MNEKETFEQEDDLTTLEFVGFCIFLSIGWVYIKVEELFRDILENNLDR